MKNSLKKIGYAVVVTLIIVGSAYSLKTFASSNGDISPLIHRGGGHQYVEGVFDIAESVGAMFGATSPNGKSAVFDEPSDGGGTFFAVLDDSWIGGRLFVGIPRDQVNGFSYSESLASNNPWSSGVQFGDMGNFFSATLQRVNVGGANGNVLATNLIHQGSSDNVCIDPKGSLVICTNFSCLNQPQHASRCDSVTLTEDINSTLSDSCDSSVACSFGCDSNYHYDSGTNSCVLNTCTGTIPAHATLCTNDDTGLSENVARVLTSTCSSPVGSTPKCEYVCSTGYHYDNDTCVVDSSATDASCFDFDTNHEMITGYHYQDQNCGSDVIIPTKINGVNVSSIGLSAFRNNQLTSVIIPNSVNAISDASFMDNQLTSVIFQGSIHSISNNAFRNNQLTSVTIPDGVDYIGSGAFRNNQLTSVTIPDSVTSIGSVAFRDNQLTSVTIPNSVTWIGDAAFWNNQLTSVTIPDSVTSIFASAFYGNQLTSVTISNSVTILEDTVFYDNQLTSVTIPDSVTSIGQDTFNHNSLTSVSLKSGTSYISSGSHPSFPSNCTVANGCIIER